MVLYSNTWEGHIETLEQVFLHLQQASLVLNLEKCDFLRVLLHTLLVGKLVGQGTVRPLNIELQVIEYFPVAKTKREMKSFLGIFS